MTRARSSLVKAKGDAHEPVCARQVSIYVIGMAAQAAGFYFIG